MAPPQTTTTAAAPANLLPPKMMVGVNYAWPANHYGYWIGPHLWDPSKPPIGPDWSTIPGNLKLYYDLGARVVRMFVIGNSNNYGSPKYWGKTKPAWDTTNRTLLDFKSRNYYEFDPPNPPDAQFASDFETLLKIFQKPELKGMKLIPSWIDFPFPEYGKVTVFFDKAKQKLFFDTMLDPLLNIAKKYPEQIYAWEVINEPAWLVRKISAPLNYYMDVPIVDDPSMKAFLSEALRRMEAAGFQSTVGHRFVSDLKDYPKGTLPQFHYYSKVYTIPIIGTEFGDPEIIPAYSGETNAFVGEFDPAPTGTGKLWKDCNGRDKDPQNCTFERLATLARKGYKLALLWPDVPSKPADDPHFSKEAQDGLKRFTGGLYTNGIP